jgi:hypothetical protein
MIISDLQHIESATEIEVNGGYAAGGCCPPSYPDYCGSWSPRPYNAANANASAQAFGTNTSTSTTTDTLVIQGQFSGSRSSSSAVAS